jgi:dihydrofolate reductase
MFKLCVRAFGVSLDGFGCGPDQSQEHPMGVGGHVLHEWFFPTRTFREMTGQDGGTTGIDDEFAKAGFENIGAWILGRNMFGPVRGGWGDESWQGWWGDEPPYHVPVFVLTHHSRKDLPMKGGTTFHFVTGGIHEALSRAKEAAGGKDVRVGGGASTIRQYLEAKLLDELHLAVAPTLMGSGENLLAD